MNVVEQYFELRNKIYEYFGFKEGLVIYPLEDYREHYWRIDDYEVHYGKKDDVLNETGDHYYINEIFEHRFYSKWIYRGEDYTMIFVDTHTDGNKFFGVYDNSKELK